MGWSRIHPHYFYDALRLSPRPGKIQTSLHSAEWDYGVIFIWVGGGVSKGCPFGAGGCWAWYVVAGENVPVVPALNFINKASTRHHYHFNAISLWYHTISTKNLPLVMVWWPNSDLTVIRWWWRGDPMVISWWSFWEAGTTGTFSPAATHQIKTCPVPKEILLWNLLTRFACRFASLGGSRSSLRQALQMKVLCFACYCVISAWVGQSNSLLCKSLWKRHKLSRHSSGASPWSGVINRLYGLLRRSEWQKKWVISAV